MGKTRGKKKKGKNGASALPPPATLDTAACARTIEVGTIALLPPIDNADGMVDGAGAAAGSDAGDIAAAGAAAGSDAGDIAPYTHLRLPISEFPLYRDESGAYVTALGGVLAPPELRAWLRWCTAGVPWEKTFQAAGNGYAHRDQSRYSWHDEERAQAIWLRIRAFVPPLPGMRAIGCLPNMRIYRYEAGESFGKHVDGSVADGDRGTTQVTVLVYLNGGGGEADCAVAGGETLFHRHHELNLGVAAVVAPRAGFVCLHSHGALCLTHEGAAVRAGEKYILRTDVVYEPTPDDG